MNTSDQTWRPAWEPLTPRGVAAFANASYGRLLLVQFLVAALTAASVIWFLERAWLPEIREAIHALPEQGGLSHGELNWMGESPQQLADNRFLGLAVDLYHSGKLGRASHLQLEFGKEDFRVYSLLGYQVLEYPRDWNIGVNQTELEPWWGAWEPWILTVIVIAIVLGLLAVWSALAVIYSAPVHVISFLENRDLTWSQSWRLASAAMLPGALFMTVGIVGYAFNTMDLIQLGSMLGLHFVIGWIYLFVSPMFCERSESAKKTHANPFATEERLAQNPFKSAARVSQNPFAAPPKSEPAPAPKPPAPEG